jgi:leukotriene-A4 hydrolase
MKLNKIKSVVFYSVITLSLACKSSSKKENMEIIDVHSYAKPNEAVVKHLDLDITVNFEAKMISGKAGYEIENIGKVKQIHLDTRDLIIEQITLGKEERPTTYNLGTEDKIFGRELTIDILPTTTYINVYYKTRPTAAALQWLTPQQTAGKEYPFLFTQSEAILARTWIPCQDSPGIRFTYNATVHVPKELLALMSAENPTEKTSEGVYTFKMEQPVPSYLMALAVGDIEFKAIGKRTGVYAEPITLDKTYYEFGEMDDMLVAAEKLYGPYAWGRYDVLMLPPSFPFGGMENPRLTFATPTVLAGDRSLVSLVAHEMAHSWSGNLVTNATWNDFWLNEGFTVYFERRIMESLHGKSYSDMLTLIGYRDLQDGIADIGPTSNDTKLKLDLKGRNPDDGVSDIAYEKGFFFLKLIEEKVGREKFDAFLKQYFADHAFQTTYTEGFLAYLKKNLFNGDDKIYNELKLDDWVYKPGLPDNCPKIVSERFEKVDAENKAFATGTPMDAAVMKEWTSQEWLHFIKNLSKDITIEQMTNLDNVFHFTQTGNSEMLDAWLLIAVEKQYKPAYPTLRTFLVNVGRRKFLTPLYKALIKTKEGEILAQDIYKEARPNYHAVATQTLDELLKFKNPS